MVIIVSSFFVSVCCLYLIELFGPLSEFVRANRPDKTPTGLNRDNRDNVFEKF